MILLFPRLFETTKDYNVNADGFDLCYKDNRTNYFHQGEIRSEYY